MWRILHIGVEGLNVNLIQHSLIVLNLIKIEALSLLTQYYHDDEQK